MSNAIRQAAAQQHPEPARLVLAENREVAEAILNELPIGSTVRCLGDGSLFHWPQDSQTGWVHVSDAMERITRELTAVERRAIDGKHEEMHWMYTVLTSDTQEGRLARESLFGYPDIHITAEYIGTAAAKRAYAIARAQYTPTDDVTIRLEDNIEPVNLAQQTEHHILQALDATNISSYSKREVKVIGAYLIGAGKVYRAADDLFYLR